jgi:AraC family transcriptional regulator, dual regulator of chb operon
MEMNVVRLFAKDIIDPEIEAHYNFFTQIKNTADRHCHDFYEIFLVVRGEVTHYVNGEEVTLTEGTLVFMRPDDVHCYDRDSAFCQFINLAFPFYSLEVLFNYLGDGFKPERILLSKLPPTAELSASEMKRAIARLETLNTLSRENKSKIRTEFRILLLEFLTRYFPVPEAQSSMKIPEWLEKLIKEMQKKENFFVGVPRLHALSNKSPEHLCRVFKEHLKVTPSQYINDLRLNYAANLLSSSDESIINVAMVSGFDNLSHFYHIFKKKFGISPAMFRNANQKTI